MLVNATVTQERMQTFVSAYLCRDNTNLTNKYCMREGMPL